MKNTRKKMLLSSIAMLLVALIALGSATFAWYITNSTVTAEKSQFSAAAADGLVIRHGENDTWKAKVTDLKTASSLTPGALNYSQLGSIFGATGSGTSFTDGTLSGDLTAATPSTDDTIFLYDSFDVASSTGSAKTVNFTIKSGTKAGTYMNLAVYVGSTLQGVFTSDTDTSNTYKLGGTSSDPTATNTTQSLTPLAASTNAGSFSAAPKTSGGTTVTIIGYADGFNEDCRNSTADVSTIEAEYSFTVAP